MVLSSLSNDGPTSPSLCRRGRSPLFRAMPYPVFCFFFSFRCLATFFLSWPEGAPPPPPPTASVADDDDDDVAALDALPAWAALARGADACARKGEG